MRNPQLIAAQHVRRLVVFGLHIDMPNFAVAYARRQPYQRGFIDSG